MKKIRFVNVMWGKSYIEAFLNYSLPSLLFPGNLLLFTKSTISEYRIYTTKKDLNMILSSETYKKLAKIITVEIYLIGGINNKRKYEAMNECHRHFLKSINNENCSIIIHTPDVIWSENSYKQLLDLLKNGKKNILIGSVRLNKETFLDAISKKFGSGLEMQQFNSRELVKIAQSHLHPETINKLFNNKGFGQGELIWPIKNEGILVRHYRLQPILITPDNKSYLPQISFDDDYTVNAVKNFNDWYVIQDSDEMCYFDFTSAKDRSEEASVNRVFSITEEAKWVQQYTGNLHRKLVKKPIYLHSESLSHNWQKIEIESEKLVNLILREAETLNPEKIKKISKLRYLNPLLYYRKIYTIGLLDIMHELRYRLMRTVNYSITFERFND